MTNQNERAALIAEEVLMLLNAAELRVTQAESQMPIGAVQQLRDALTNAADNVQRTQRMAENGFYRERTAHERGDHSACDRNCPATL